MNKTVNNIADDESVVKVDGNVEVQSIATLMRNYAITSGDKTFQSLYSKYFDNSGMPRNGTTEENITALYDYIFNANGKMASSVLHKDGSYDASLIQISTNTGGDNKR